MYNNAAAMGRLTAAGYPANLFVVNPAVAGGGSYLLTNLGSSNYNALQVEMNRRLTSGPAVAGQLRVVALHGEWKPEQPGGLQPAHHAARRRQDKVPGGYDIRQAFKINSVYELPFGTDRRSWPAPVPVVRKVVEGWQISGISRVQSGTPFQLTSGRTGMNTGVNSVDTGVVLYNMTTQPASGHDADPQDHRRERHRPGHVPAGST